MSVDQVGANLCAYNRSRSRNSSNTCPSIRLVPTSAPIMPCNMLGIEVVSVDQVGANLCAADLALMTVRLGVSVDQVGANLCAVLTPH